MQGSIPLKTPPVVLKKKRKLIKAARQAGAALHLKECDEKDFILLEWGLPNGYIQTTVSYQQSYNRKNRTG